jgi:polyisoprenoid-binding protein YceI
MIHSTSTRSTIALLAMIFAAPLFAATWHSVPADSMLEFVVTFEGEESAGRFGVFQAEFEFEPERSTKSSLRVMVDVRSATMSSADLDEAIAEETWFDSAAFPMASFTADVSQLSENQTFLAKGKVTIKGVERDLDLPLNLSVEDDRIQMSGSVALSRLDFGIGTGEWLSDSSIGYPVLVRFKVTLQKTD